MKKGIKNLIKLPKHCDTCFTKINKDSKGHTSPEMIFTCESCFMKKMGSVVNVK